MLINTSGIVLHIEKKRKDINPIMYIDVPQLREFIKIADEDEYSFNRNYIFMLNIL